MDYFDADTQREPANGGGVENGAEARNDKDKYDERDARPPPRRDSRSPSPMRGVRDGDDDRRDGRRDRSPLPPRRRSRSASPGRGGGGGGGGYGGYRRRGEPPRPSHAPAHVEPTNVLGAFGLSTQTTERDLERVFGDVAKVQKAIIVYDARTGRSRGFGFVTMADVEGATAAIKELNGIDLQGRQIRVDYSTTHKAHEPTPGRYMGEVRPNDRWTRDGPGGDRDRDRDRDRGGSWRSPPPRGGYGGGGGWRDRDRDYGPPPPRGGGWGSDRYGDRDRDRYGGGGGGYDSRPPPPSRRHDDDDWRRRSPPPPRRGGGGGGGRYDRSPSPPPPRRYRSSSRSPLPPPARREDDEPPFEP